MSGGGSSTDQFGVWNPAGEKGFDPVSFQYDYSRDQGMTPTEAAANAGTGGLFVNAFTGAVATREAKQQAAEAQRKIEEEQARRSGLVTQLRSKYGIGDGADAQASSRTLSDYLKDYYNAYLTNQLGQVDNQFASATKTSRQNLARVGQLGSGLDTSTRSGNLADFIKARQDALAAAARAKDSLSSNLTSQRLGLEQQIQAGTLANPDFNSLASQQSALIGQARSQIPSAAIGNLFTTAGQSYNVGAQQGAYGNQGLSAFGFGSGSGSGSGRITGG